MVKKKEGVGEMQNVSKMSWGKYKLLSKNSGGTNLTNWRE